METKYELYEELLSILKLCYTVIQIDSNKSIIKPLESDIYVSIEWKDNTVVVTTQNDNMWIFELENRLSVGTHTLDIENILIREAHLSHKPIALTIYLYYRLLGLLWGARATKELQNQDPVPERCAYVELYGPTKDGKELKYVYKADATGAIWVEKYIEGTIKLSYIVIYPLLYIENPTGSVEDFFDFFKDVTCITRIGRG